MLGNRKGKLAPWSCRSSAPPPPTTGGCENLHPTARGRAGRVRRPKSMRARRARLFQREATLSVRSGTPAAQTTGPEARQQGDGSRLLSAYVHEPAHGTRSCELRCYGDLSWIGCRDSRRIFPTPYRGPRPPPVAGKGRFTAVRSPPTPPARAASHMRETNPGRHKQPLRKFHAAVLVHHHPGGKTSERAKSRDIATPWRSLGVSTPPGPKSVSASAP